MNQLIEMILGISGALFALYLPGFVISLALFGRGKIDVLERVGLSLGLSVAVVPLVAFYLNLLGVSLTRANVALEVLGIIAISGAIAWWRARVPAEVIKKPMREPKKLPPVRRRVHL